jgi:hypothetical protein
MSIQALIATVVSCSLVILATLGCTTEEEVEDKIKREATSATIIQITALNLIAEYEANEIAADQKYEGTILDITGTIDDFGEDILGTKYLTFSDGSDFSITNVQCFFSDNHVSQLANLQKGQRITVRGKGDGKLFNVHVRGCSIP